MPRITSSLRLLSVVALSVYVAGCGSSSTGPQTTPSAYAGSYKGIFAGTGINGTAAITVGQVSADLTRGPGIHAEGGNPDAVTVTLATTSGGSITLTGTISGNTATVTSTTPPATCTITFTTTGATGSCTEAPYGTFSLAAFVFVNGIEATVYCGTQSPGVSPAFFPNATLGAAVSGPNMYLVVAPPTGTPTLYGGTIASNSVSLTSTSSGGAVYNGTVTGTTAISGTITGGGSGSWAVANPCVQGVLAVSTTAVPVSANVGSTATITPAPVTITNSGSSGSTLGVLGVGAATYSPSATSGWLQASLPSPTTMGGTLSLSVTPPSGIAAGTYAAAVPITASLGTGSPQTVTVTLTVTAGVTITSTSPLGSAVDLIQYSDQLTATGGTGTITWSLATGSTLPTWLTLSPSGLLSGTAPAGTVYPASAPLTFSVTATDGTTSSTKQFQIVVFANVTITSTSPLPTAYFTVPYSYQFTATGGPTSSYQWSIGTGGGLPSWLTLTTSGLLSGTPPTGAAPPTFTVVVASGGSFANVPFTLPITTVPPVVVTTTQANFPSATVGVAYGPVQLTATGGPTGHYGWALSATSNLLPAGLTLSLAGVISGIPTTPTTMCTTPNCPPFSVTASDGTFTGEGGPFTITVNPPACTITITSFGVLTQGTYAYIPLTKSANCPPVGFYEWSANPGLPAGLNFEPDEDIVAGTPTGTGAYSFTLSIVGNGGYAGSVNMPTISGTIGAEAGCAIGPVLLPDGVAGQDYFQGLTPSTQCTNPADNPAAYVWTLSAAPGQTGAPPELTIDNNGQLRAVPLNVGDAGKTYTFTVNFSTGTQTDNNSNVKATIQYTFKVDAPPAGARVRVASMRVQSK